MLRKAIFGAAAAAILAGSPAWAHGPFGSDTSIWLASYHLATSPLSIAALVGLALVLFGMREPDSIIAATLAAAASVVASMLLPHLPQVAAPITVAVIGLAAVFAWSPARAAAFVLAVLAGLAAGLAADLEKPRWIDLAGMGATVLLASFWLLAASDNLNRSARLQSVLPIGRRVLGSWVTAMALLLAALGLLGKPL